ncbi:hypothetical protein [Clostridium sp.]|uniref:hypothetical protein n=1 Tax=Clostridium sp. TaxID=1506 RepID=UPI003F2E0787
MYEGNRLFCGTCKHVSRSMIENGKEKYTKCKNIDHDKIKLYPKIYGGYSESIRNCEICGHYEPKEYIKNPSFKNMEEYIDFMENEWYDTTEYYKSKGISKFKDCKWVSLIIEDIWIEVSLYDWMSNSWICEDTIKYIGLYKIKRDSKGKMKSRKAIDNLPLGERGLINISDIKKREV